MKKTKAILIVSGVLSMNGFLFQNCSGGVDFNSVDEVSTGDQERSQPENTEIPDRIEGGLVGGHFDIDTSTQIYNFSKGDTDHHVHEYDDKHNVTYADFFSLLEPKLGEITEHVSGDDQFILLIGNAQLSPGAILEINGVRVFAKDYQKNVTDYINGDKNALKVYSIGSSRGTSAIPLTSLKILFEPNAIINGGLLPTQTGCVVDNRAGKLGEYRNGALLIQAVDINRIQLDTGTQTASAGLLWESTIFWHKQKSGCYQ